MQEAACEDSARANQRRDLCTEKGKARSKRRRFRDWALLTNQRSPTQALVRARRFCRRRCPSTACAP